MAQLEDRNFTSALQQVSVVDGRLMDGVSQIICPHFTIKDSQDSTQHW